MEECGRNRRSKSRPGAHGAWDGENGCLRGGAARGVGGRAAKRQVCPRHPKVAWSQGKVAMRSRPCLLSSSKSLLVSLGTESGRGGGGVGGNSAMRGDGESQRGSSRQKRWDKGPSVGWGPCRREKGQDSRDPSTPDSGDGRGAGPPRRCSGEGGICEHPQSHTWADWKPTQQKSTLNPSPYRSQGPTQLQGLHVPPPSLLWSNRCHRSR